MTDSNVPGATDVGQEAARSDDRTPEDRRSDSLWRAVLRNPLGMIASAVLGLIVLTAFLVPVFIPQSAANASRLDLVLAPPGGEYLLGGDAAGRDIFARLLLGARPTLIGATLAVTTAVVLGAVSGLVAGYFGRLFDAVASWVANVLLALPALIILLALYQSLGASVFVSMVVFGVILSPGVFRLVRNQVVGVKNELYVDAARVSGLSNTRIIGRHILGAVRSPLIIQAAILAGLSIIIQAALEFLGLGDASQPTWGRMLNEAQQNINRAPLLIIWPGIAISLTVMSLVLLGNAARDALRRQRAALESEPQRDADDVRVHALPDDLDEALLIVEDLTIGYGSDDSPNVVVDHVSFHVAQGEVLGIVGESGSGKSQTSLAILGLLPKGGRILEGRITFKGTDITDASGSKQAGFRGHEIAYVPQEPMSNLDPAFTVGHQLVEPIRAVLGLSRREAKQRALELLAKVGINEPERTFAAYPHEISGGMAQRVLIAGAIACHPVLLIADEPTTALDVTVQADVLDLLRDLQDDLQMSMILVTHDFGVVADICDRVAVMRSGRLVEADEAHRLFDDPQHPYTQMLLDSTMDDAPPRGALTGTEA